MSGDTEVGDGRDRVQLQDTDGAPPAATTRDVYAELPYLLALARRMTRNSHDAHDLVQDALVRALPALATVSSGSHLRAWLTTIVRNVHIDRLRRIAREPKAVSIDEVRIEALWVADDASDRDDAMGIEDVEEALATLPETFRRVFVLHELEGRPYREISSALDIPLATVGTRLNRARLKLRMLLTAKRAGVQRASSPGTAAPARRDSTSSHSERALLAAGFRRRG